MNMPQEKLSEPRAEGQTGAATPANENATTLSVVETTDVYNAWAAVKSGLIARLAGIPAAMTSLDSVEDGFMEQIRARSFETMRVPTKEKEIVGGTPAVILKKELRRNYKVSEENPKIYTGIWDDPRIGRPLKMFSMPQNLGPMTPNDAMAKVSSLKVGDGYGHRGLDIGISRDYEDNVIELLKSGKGSEQWFLMLYVHLGGKNYPARGEAKSFDGNLLDNWNKGDLAQATVVTSGSFLAKYFGSSTPPRDDPEVYVLIARPKDGGVYGAHRYGTRVSWLPVLAQG